MSFIKWLLGYKTENVEKTQKQLETEKKIKEIKEEKKRLKVIKKIQLNTEIVEKLPKFKKATCKYNLRNKKKISVNEVIDEIEGKNNNNITTMSLEEFIGSD